MWVAKVKYKHDCILGNRCEKFKVSLQTVVFSTFKDRGKVVTSSLHLMSGNLEDINSFVKDLKKDKNVIRLERHGNSFFLLEKADKKAVKFYTPKIIFIKPFLLDKYGFETWEVGSWEKDEVSKFINNIKREIKTAKLLKFHRVSIDDVFFPKLLPDLTAKQKRAIELATEEGYYEVPKKTSLRKLAKLSKVSLATYQNHLQKAESKVIPDVLSFLK